MVFTLDERGLLWYNVQTIQTRIEHLGELTCGLNQLLLNYVLDLKLLCT
jgi:hypothetical protein